MNILIDVGHPAHVHYFRNLAKLLSEKGHKVYWATKDIPIVIQLLEKYNFEFIVLPKKSDNLIGKILKQLLWNLLQINFWGHNKKSYSFFFEFHLREKH